MANAHKANRFQYYTGNVVGTRIASAYGTVVTPGNNTYPGWLEILAPASIAHDCQWVYVNINNGIAGKATLVSIGIDRAGGTSYTDFIPHLMAHGAGNMGAAGGGGYWYAFPMLVPAGSRLAAKATIANATVGTIRVAVWLLGRPTVPELVKPGLYCEAFGAVPGSSTGTTIAEGSATKSSWTRLGSRVNRHSWFQIGYGFEGSSLLASQRHIDLALGAPVVAPAAEDPRHVVCYNALHAALGSGLTQGVPINMALEQSAFEVGTSSERSDLTEVLIRSGRNSISTPTGTFSSIVYAVGP